MFLLSTVSESATSAPRVREPSSMRRRVTEQLDLPSPPRWGGARAGAGRKREARRPSPPHHPRTPHEPRHPVHVTMRATAAIPSLRAARIFAALSRAISASMLLWFRVIHFSIQRDHVHLIVEADDAASLARGLRGLAARAAKAVNRAAVRTGRVWESRYHTHALRSPTETRRGIAYVLLNFQKHLHAEGFIDPRSSGPWFDGWCSPPVTAGPRPVASPRTWLAATGWRRAGGPIGDGLTAPGASRGSRSRRR
jgi:hypothetical protein